MMMPLYRSPAMYKTRLAKFLGWTSTRIGLITLHLCSLLHPSPQGARASNLESKKESATPTPNTRRTSPTTLRRARKARALPRRRNPRVPLIRRDPKYDVRHSSSNQQDLRRGSGDIPVEQDSISAAVLMPKRPSGTAVGQGWIAMPTWQKMV